MAQVPAVFLKPLQGLLKTARMNPDAELGLDQRGQPARSHPAVPGPVVLDEAQDLRADLVRSSRPAPRRDELLQPAPVERLDHAEAGRPRDPEPRRRLREARFVYTDQPDHLVADLEQVAGIEEVAGGEHRVADLFRRSVEGAGLPEPVLLFGVVATVCHGGAVLQSCFNNYYAIYRP